MAANKAHDDIGIGFNKKLQLIHRLNELSEQVGKQVKFTCCETQGKTSRDQTNWSRDAGF